MKREAIFTSRKLINELSTDKNENVFIEDMVTGQYYRCFGVVFDEDGNMIIRAKNLHDLHNGVNDLYME